MERKLRMGMIGGGKDAFIGAVHRSALILDGLIELKAGALSSRPEVASESGKALFLDPDRVYSDYNTMLEQEARKPPEERLDFITIVTPNFVHFDPAVKALEHGFHVVLDKPMTFTLDEAVQLQQRVKETGKLLLLTHTYTGYPMVKQARQMVKEGRLGKIRKVYVEYPQGWLSEPVENKQASWRTDPGKSGKAGCMGDIGTHAANLAEYISGAKISRICADLNTVVEGRMLDDDGGVLLRFDNGASGVLTASQVAAGEENALKIRVYGEKGGMEWAQEEPNTLVLKWLDKPREIYRTGGPGLSAYAGHNTRVPPGHPEGYLEAFANLYRNFALTLSARLEGTEPPEEALDFPGADEGVRGMLFIDKVVESSSSDQKWTEFK